MTILRKFNKQAKDQSDITDHSQNELSRTNISQNEIYSYEKYEDAYIQKKIVENEHQNQSQRTLSSSQQNQFDKDSAKRSSISTDYNAVQEQQDAQAMIKAEKKSRHLLVVMDYVVDEQSCFVAKYTPFAKIPNNQINADSPEQASYIVQSIKPSRFVNGNTRNKSNQINELIIESLRDSMIFSAQQTPNFVSKVGFQHNSSQRIETELESSQKAFFKDDSFFKEMKDQLDNHIDYSTQRQQREDRNCHSLKSIIHEIQNINHFSVVHNDSENNELQTID